MKFELAENLKEAIPKAPHINTSLEWALYHALMLFKDDVSAQFEASKTFYDFHKSFRQTDVTETAHGDIIIWELLSQSELISTVFKQTKKNIQKPTTPN